MVCSCIVEGRRRLKRENCAASKLTPSRHRGTPQKFAAIFQMPAQEADQTQYDHSIPPVSVDIAQYRSVDDPARQKVKQPCDHHPIPIKIQHDAPMQLDIASIDQPHRVKNGPKRKDQKQVNWPKAPKNFETFDEKGRSSQ